VSTPRLKLMDLVLGLESFGTRYQAISVFADDLSGARSAELVPGLFALDEAGKLFRFTVPGGQPHGGETYDLRVVPERGIASMSRATLSASASGALSPCALASPDMDRAADNAKNIRGEAASDEHVFGLLAGRFLGGDTGPDAPRRVFTMRFDLGHRQWQAYDGGLVPWMKEHLLPKST
jgi:hypothetical protein